MIRSVKERKENSSKFSLCYEDICKIKKRMPLPCVKVHLKKNILDFNGDRITFDEWGPILHALSLDKSLHFIGIRSKRSSKTAMEDVTTESKARVVERVPVVQTRFVLMLLMKAIKECMTNTNVLSCMELEGLPLSKDYLNELKEGVVQCKSLQNISFHRSPIGDEGCKLLCTTIKGLANIISMDLSNCGLSGGGALAIADILKFQKLQRFTESWKHTLRYRQPDLDSLPGLRRVTLNHNVDIGDQGVMHIMDVIKDDLFLKALDLQNCGIGNVGGEAVLDMLHSNVSIAVVDVRANHDLKPELLKQIMRQLHANNVDHPQQYKWIAVDRFQVPRQLTRTRPLSHSTTKMASTVKFTTETSVPKRSQSDKGMPWRISVRMDRRKEHSEVSPGTPRMMQHQEQAPPYQSTTPPPTPRFVELENAKAQLQWLTGQLNMEMMLRKKAEEENVTLQKRLEEVTGNEDCILIEKQTMEAIQQSFKDFQAFMKKVRCTGLQGLLDEDIVESLASLNTDDKGRLTCIMRKSNSAHTTRDKCNQTDLHLHKVSKSMSTFRNVNASEVRPVETGVGDTGRQVLPADGTVSSEGTVGTLTCQECSSDSTGASSEDSDVLLPKDRAVHRRHKKHHEDSNDILYQTVLRKNRELNSLPPEPPKDTTQQLRHQRGSSSSSDSSVSYRTDDDLF